MGALDRDEADMGVANLFLSYRRIGVVDFSFPYDFEVGSISISLASKWAFHRESDCHVGSYQSIILVTPCFFLCIYLFLSTNKTVRQ